VKTILIVDTDLGFVFWLGRILDNAGFEALPAKTVADAANLLSWLSVRLDLLVINPSCSHTIAFVEERRSDGLLKIIGIHDGESHDEVAGINVWLKKPEQTDELSGVEWLQRIESVLAADDSGDPETRAARG
jgi:DNA-binding response OmpR family regulator